MSYDLPPRRPRLILDENIDFSSLDILIRHGLDRRCSTVYEGWHGEKMRHDELMRQRQGTAIDAGRVEIVETMVRIKKGIAKWMAGQAVARYPCVLGCVTVRKLMA